MAVHWLHRNFKFDFPAELFPSFCARLRGTPARLEELTKDGTHDRLVYRPHDTWSMQENAGHLLDLEALWRKRVDEFLARTPVLTAADMSNRGTHEARHNERSMAELLAAFRSARQLLMDRLDALPAEEFSRSALHPRLGVPMRLVDHLSFMAEHDDHHLARIWEIRRQVRG